MFRGIWDLLLLLCIVVSSIILVSELLRDYEQYKQEIIQKVNVNINSQLSNQIQKEKCLSALNKYHCPAAKEGVSASNYISGKVCFPFHQKFIIAQKAKECNKSGYWFIDPTNCMKSRFISSAWTDKMLAPELKKMGFERIWWKSNQSAFVRPQQSKPRVPRSNDRIKSAKLLLFERRDCDKSA